MSALKLCLLASAAICTVAIENPTGSCMDESNNPMVATSRSFVPGSDSVYLKDCGLDFLEKEYWRVFARSDESGSTAYVIPRPDGRGLQYGYCDDGNEHRELFAKYQLCQETVTDVQLVNNMLPVDALRITRLLHERLQFQKISEGNGFFQIDPFVYDEDTLAACELLDAQGVNEAASYCEDVANRCSDDGVCIEIVILPSEADVDALIPAVNTLYGIDEGVGTAEDLRDSNSVQDDDSATGAVRWSAILTVLTILNAGLLA